MDKLSHILLAMSVSGGLLTLPLLVVQKMKTLRAAWKLACCCAALLFFLVPFGLLLRGVLPAMPPSALSTSPAPYADPAAGGDYRTVADAQPVPDIPAQTASESQDVFAKIFPFTTGELLLFLWLIGTVVAALRQGGSYLCFIRRLRQSAVPVQDADILALYRRCAQSLGVKRLPQLLESDAAPFLCGILRPRLVLHRGITSKEALELVLHHELIHYKSRHLLLKQLAALAQCIHWWNPLAFLLTRSMERCCELACDEQLVAEMDAAQRRAYGMAILNAMEHGAARSAAVSFADTKRNIQERLEYMMKTIKPTRTMLSAIIISAICVIMLGCGAAAAISPQINFARQEEPAAQGQSPVTAKDSQETTTETPVTVQNTEKEQQQCLDEASLLQTDQSYQWPVPSFPGPLVSFADQNGQWANTHNGIDIASTAEKSIANAPVVAAKSGMVAQLGESEAKGRFLVLNHADGQQTYYEHLQGFAEGLGEGDSVTQGEVIGFVGNTGRSTGYHLHFGLRIDGTFVDPTPYFIPINY